MFAKTPGGKIQAFAGVQFGHPVFLVSLFVAELRKWTFSDMQQGMRKISGGALVPGSEPDASTSRPITIPAIVLGTSQSLRARRFKTGEDLVYLQLHEEIEYTVLSGHDTIAGLGGDTHSASYITVEIHAQCDAARLHQARQSHDGSTAHQRHAKRSILDDRGDWMAITRQTIDEVGVFTGRVEMTKTALSNRSRNLFTFSAIHQANIQLLGDRKQLSVADRREIAAHHSKPTTHPPAAHNPAASQTPHPKPVPQLRTSSHAACVPQTGLEDTEQAGPCISSSTRECRWSRQL